jgi:hypothetical protein
MKRVIEPCLLSTDSQFRKLSKEVIARVDKKKAEVAEEAKAKEA